MFSEKIKEQAFAIKVLKAHLKRDRLAHAYLLSGGKDSGKEEIALAFAKALNCSKGRIFQDCDCLNCHKIETHNHPDVVWIGEDLQARSIKIEEIRELISRAALKPYEGMRKVFILIGAARLTIDASNALLKTLEEPPPVTLILLLVENKANLLETIQSRTFEIRLRPLELSGMVGNEDAREWLQDFKQKDWEDLLESYQSKPREELKEVLNSMMGYFRERLYEALKKSDFDRRKPSVWLDAMDQLSESKEALSANANQKLVLTRLAMHLRKVPREKITS